MKTFNPAYPLKSELIHSQHQNSLIHPLNFISGLLQTRGELYVFTPIYTEAEPNTYCVYRKVYKKENYLD